MDSSLDYSDDKFGYDDETEDLPIKEDVPYEDEDAPFDSWEDGSIAGL